MHLLLNLDVPSLPEAVAFYQQALGLRTGRHLFEGSVVEMLGAPVPLYLLRKVPGSFPYADTRARRDYERHWMPMHLDFIVDDLDVALSRAIAAGARQEGRVSEQPWGRLATLSDPFGHGFCLLQWRGEGYAQMVSKQGEQNAHD